jgi:hypothetical protein
MKIVLSIFAVGILVVGAFFGALAWQRLCLPLRGVEVTVNGEWQEAVSAHTCPNGRVRVVIPGQPMVLIDPDWRGGSYPGTGFENILGFTFARDPDPVGVSMQSTPKTAIDPRLEFRDNSIAYTSMQTHDRVVIRLVK